ncbi:hypothetical protein AB0L71_28265 [Streptomyces sp. NPDC052052]
MRAAVSRRAIAQLWPNKSLSTREIGRRVGMTLTGVRYHAQVMGLPARDR